MPANSRWDLIRGFKGLIQRSRRSSRRRTTRTRRIRRKGRGERNEDIMPTTSPMMD